MKITIDDIKQVLKKLLEHKLSREEASLWAYNIRQTADDNKLIYCPEENEDLIWESILFIEGIDLQIEPGIYLHNQNDIQLFHSKILQGSA